MMIFTKLVCPPFVSVTNLFAIFSKQMLDSHSCNISLILTLPDVKSGLGTERVIANFHCFLFFSFKF